MKHSRKQFKKLLKQMSKEITDKPKNSARIGEILKLIEKIWKKAPNMLLCQLIGNCFESGDLYYKEDDVLVKELKSIYRNLLKEDK